MVCTGLKGADWIFQNIRARIIINDFNSLLFGFSMKKSGTGTSNLLQRFAAILREISICIALPTGLKIGFFAISFAQGCSVQAMDMGTIRSG